MKKLMAILAVFSLIMPFANVHAATEITNCSVSSSCFVYTPGMEVNFYRSDKEAEAKDNGLTTIILEDPGSNSQYVKTLVIGNPFGSIYPYFDDGAEDLPLTLVKPDHLGHIDKTSKYPWESVRRDAESNIDLSYPSLNEIVSVFGATQESDDKYTIDVNKWGELLAEVVRVGVELETRSSKGFYTSTYDMQEEYVWVVKYTWDDAKEKLTAITIEKEDLYDQNEYSYVPVVYFDKTYDCHDRVNQEEMACYSCDDDYKWIKIGAQADTCVLIENITSKGSCVKAVQTGVEDYLIEFVGISLVCGIALVIAKKKDLFRAI